MYNADGYIADNKRFMKMDDVHRTKKAVFALFFVQIFRGARGGKNNGHRAEEFRVPVAGAWDFLGAYRNR